MSKPMALDGFVCGDGGCRQLTEADREWVESIILQANEGKAIREKVMPDAAAAVHVLAFAHARLRELGWCDPDYAPKDRTPLLLIEAGSTGIHRGYRDDIGFWITDGDVWPSRPVVWRAAPTGAQEEREP